MSSEQEVIERASSWCASNGILMGSSGNKQHAYVYEPAPFSLHPTPYPNAAFDAAYNLSKPFNQMVHKVAESYSTWLRGAIDTAARGDSDFTGKLVQLAEEVMQSDRVQKVVLGILRSDYMLHNDSYSPSYHGKIDADRIVSTEFQGAIPLQVELNTIASSFGCLSSKITHMHQSLQELPYPQKVSNALISESSNYGVKLPENGAGENIADGIAAAVNEYNRQRKSYHTVKGEGDETNIESVVLMVIEEGDNNSCDQRDLEFLLQKNHQIRLIRRTLEQIATTAKSSPQSIFEGKELLLPDGDKPMNKVVVAVAYFRAGYTPDHYPFDIQWKGRGIIEHSAAIKCPDIFYHLVGAKKIQQELAAPKVLRQFCQSDKEEQALQSTFAGLYALGEDDEHDSDIITKAIESPHSFVLKPQREGGGNNLYDDDLVEALKTMSKQERGGYILMQKILPPSVQGVLVKCGQVIYDGEIVCELGVFGISLREYSNASGDGINQGGRILMDKVGGHILRSKNVNTDEGGVAAGYAFLSSPRLV